MYGVVAIIEHVFYFCKYYIINELRVIEESRHKSKTVRDYFVDKK